jgi:hypothetical protein
MLTLPAGLEKQRHEHRVHRFLLLAAHHRPALAPSPRAAVTVGA